MKKIMAFLMAFSFISSTPSDSVQYEELTYSEEVKKKKKKGKKMKGKGKKKKKGFFSKVFGSK
jgi:hypothetical protein|tara:strand:+ start:316 stop:504 length:189 start_codon:yes stop_codon:yes gene_type:complete